MLSWSAEDTGRRVDISRLIGDGGIGIPAGAELVGVGRASVGVESNPGPVAAVAEVIGEPAAVYAAAVAAAFELLNRAVDAIGLPTGPASRRRLADVIQALDMESFPHAHL